MDPEALHPSPELINMDNDWVATFQQLQSSLPAEDKALLLDANHQKPFTSANLLESINERLEKYKRHPFQRFIGRIEPVLSHIHSFTGIINTFVQTHPEISGLFWGSLRILITVNRKLHIMKLMSLR